VQVHARDMPECAEPTGGYAHFACKAETEQ